MSTTNSNYGSILILGRKEKTLNYEHFIHSMNFHTITSLSPYHFEEYDGLLLPGGGDIEPAFFGQHNLSSRSIDTELDILQLQALDFFIRQKKPVLDICKGMQLINIYFGGSINQSLPEKNMHTPSPQYGKDVYHPVTNVAGSPFFDWWGHSCIVNSYHHQCITTPGKGLKIFQTAPDGVAEGFLHETLPVLGVQWHPERIPVGNQKMAYGKALFTHFFRECLANRQPLSTI